MNKVDTIQKIPVTAVVFDDLQPRQASRKNQLDDLAEDMAERGQIYPIIVRQDGDKFHLLDGERRTRAATINGQREIEAIVVNTAGPLEDYELQAVANFKRVENKIQETAKWLARFKEQFAIDNPGEDPIVRVIQLTGYSRNYFDSADAINRSEESFRDNIFEGKVGGYAATEIEGASKDASIRTGLQEAYSVAADNGVAVSALAPRPLRQALRDIEANDDYTPQQRQSIARNMLLKKYRIMEAVNEGGADNFLVYVEIVRQWVKDVETWDVSAFSPKEQKAMSAELYNLIHLFNGMWMSANGPLEATHGK